MRRRDWASSVAALVALAIAVLVVGGALRWVQALVAVVVGIALVPGLASRHVFDRISPLIVMAGTAAGLTALQLIPLPEIVLAFANPTGEALRQDGARLLDIAPWQSLSLDAPGSLRALAMYSTLLGVAVVALRISSSERGRYRVLASVGALLGLTAVIVGVHELFGARRLYGIYTPDQATPSVLGPLLNENQLGGLMAIGTTLGIGLVMYHRQHLWTRTGWALVIALCGAVTALSKSRGAALALIAGASVTIGMMVAQRFVVRSAPRHRRATFLTSSLPIAVVALCAVVIIVYASAGGLTRDLSRTTLQEIHNPTNKFAAWRSATTLIEESPWVGVGRGAFEAAFTRVHPASAFATFSHVENEYLQAVVDWGVPGALALGLATLWLVLAAVRRWRDGPLAAAALGSLTVVMLQSNVDFGVELLGLAVPVTAIAATLTYVPLREPTKRVLMMSRLARLALIVGLACAALLLLSKKTTPLSEDHANLAQRNPPAVDDLREVLERHPLDYYSYALASQAMSRTGDSRAIRLLNHALTLHPTHPGLHHMAARLLYAAGRVDQATLEYAATIRWTADPRKLVVEILPRFSREQVASAIPADLGNTTDIVKLLEDLRRPDVAIAWLTHVLDLRPNNIRACELFYDTSLRHGDLQSAEIASRRCTEFEPSHQTRLSLAQIILQKKGYAEVIRLLEDIEAWTGKVNEKITGWLTLCDAHTGLHNWDAAKRCLRRLDASGYLSPELRGEVKSRIEQIDTKRKDADAQVEPDATHPPLAPTTSVLPALGPPAYR